MKLTQLTPIRAGGGCMFVVAGAAPFAAVVWHVTQGAGALTPTSPRADHAGVASARYDASGDVEGASVEVEADVYA